MFAQIVLFALTAPLILFPSLLEKLAGAWGMIEYLISILRDLLEGRVFALTAPLILFPSLLEKLAGIWGMVEYLIGILRDLL